MEISAEKIIKPLILGIWGDVSDVSREFDFMWFVNFMVDVENQEDMGFELVLSWFILIAKSNHHNCQEPSMNPGGFWQILGIPKMGDESAHQKHTGSVKLKDQKWAEFA